MNTDVIKDIFKDKNFYHIIKNLYIGKTLSDRESEFLLGFVILLLQEYDKKRNRLYFEFAYDLVLRYSVSSKNYQPLYDVSCNYGFYPTVRFINKKRMLEKISIDDAINDYKLEKYKNETYIETYEQNHVRNKVINSEKCNVSFIAPTSSGKSSVIIQHIKKYNEFKKSIILVPTKSLIAQTYTELRKSEIDKKIITHENMYTNEDRFVGALTQERALRLLENNNDIIINCIYVDEAHNIFNNDARNVLLCRVIKECKNRNKRLKVIYLSPFINDSKHLLQGEEVDIDEQRICFNIKEPIIREYGKDGSISVYNRFCNNFFRTDDIINDPFDYMFSCEKKKNFCFLNSPKKIELFAEELFKRTEEVEITKDLKELQELLKENIHPDFSMIKYLTHGIIYLHAKLPDQIKEYLEHQFKINPSIKYMVANSVILEGINMPIDSLFIWDVNLMNNSKLQNLIGRVNRLNNVYDINNCDLDGLLPNVHFINSDFYFKNKRKMSTSILKLYNDLYDEITNPFLNSYDVEKLPVKDREKTKVINNEIIKEEQLYFSSPDDERQKFKRKLVASGMNQLISISDESVDKVIDSIHSVDLSKSIIEIVSDVFVKNGVAKDKAFLRLKNTKAVNYYKHFINANHKGNLFSLINSEFYYHKERKTNGESLMYIGKTYGEVSGFNYENGGKVFIDLNTKTDAELVNYIIVKIKVEQDFLSFQYNRAVNFLHDYGIIDDERYNLEIYGTNNEKKIQMLNMGIPIGIVSLLESENQLNNIYKDVNGNLKGKPPLREFAFRQNDFWKYQIRKHIFF